MPFVKLDKGLLTSTLWSLRPELEVFVTALLLAEPREFTESTPTICIGSLKDGDWDVPPGWYGFVAASGPSLVDLAHVDQSRGIEALRRLGMPEPESRSQAFGGRRLVRIDGGFLVLNFMKYRDYDHSAADRMRRLRMRKKEAVNYEFDANGESCECCGVTVAKRVVDHDHSTNARRGMVCLSCNRSIGLLENGKMIDSAKKVIISEYLMRFSVTRQDVTETRNVTHSRVQSAEAESESIHTSSEPAAPPPLKAESGDALLIYKAYPRLVGRKAALKAIAAALKVKPKAELLERVEAFALATKSWPAGDHQFSPHPATWFNRGSYDDDPREWQRQGGTWHKEVQDDKLRRQWEAKIAEIEAMDATDDKEANEARQSIIDDCRRKLAALQ